MTQKHSLTIQAVSIIGGILTAIFFLGFLALARILRSDISCLIVGSILILATLTISRMVIRSFLDAMNITLYIAGCVLIGFGINASINILFTTLIGISILTFLLSRGFILPFLSVIGRRQRAVCARPMMPASDGMPYFSILPGRSSTIFLHAHGSTRFCAPTCTAVAPADIISMTSSAVAMPPTPMTGRPVASLT